MAPQSRPLSLLLTRPAAQGDRFVAELSAQMPGSFVPISSPLMAPVFLSPVLPAEEWSALILTSETGVEAAARMLAAGSRLPGTAFCVGDRTAESARAKGFDAISAQGDAEALISFILSSDDQGPFLHLRGRDARGDIAPRLAAQGRKAQAVIVYAQEPRSLTSAARKALADSDPVVVPLFSPRSAALFADQGPFAAPLWIAAISAATARAAEPLLAERLHVAERPDAAAMVAAVRSVAGSPAP